MSCPCPFFWEIGIVPAPPPCHPLCTLAFSNCRIRLLWKRSLPEDLSTLQMKGGCSARPFLCAHLTPEASGRAWMQVHCQLQWSESASPIHQMAEQKHRPRDSQDYVLRTSWKKAQNPFSTYFYMKVSGLRRRNAYNMHVCTDGQKNVDVTWKIWS